VADRYLEAVQCLNRIAPERFARRLTPLMPRGAAIFQEGCDPALMEIVFQFQMSNFGGSD